MGDNSEDAVDEQRSSRRVRAGKARARFLAEVAARADCPEPRQPGRIEREARDAARLMREAVSRIWRDETNFFPENVIDNLGHLDCLEARQPAERPLVDGSSAEEAD